jgi:hypothetical protein
LASSVLPTPGGAQKQKRAHRSARRLHAGPGPTDRRGHGGHGLGLADHPLGQVLLRARSSFCAFTGQQPLHGDAGRAGHHIGDVARLDLLAQQRIGPGQSRCSSCSAAAAARCCQLVVLAAGPRSS